MTKNIDPISIGIQPDIAYEVNPYKLYIKEGERLVRKHSANKFLKDELEKLNVIYCQAVKNNGESHYIITHEGQRISTEVVAIQGVDVSPYVMHYKPFAKIRGSYSKAAQKLLAHMEVHCIEMDRDDVYFDFKLMERDGISSRQYYRAIPDLLKSKLLAKSYKGPTVFWLNINYIFKGDRRKLLNIRKARHEAMQIRGKDNRFDNIKTYINEK